MAKTTLAALYAAGEPGDSADVLVARAQLFLDKGRSEVAEHLFRRALDLAPAFYWASMGVAHICVAAERFEEAEAAYRQSLGSATSPEEAIYARTGLATALAGLGQAEQAESLFEQVIAEVPDYVYAYTGLALVYETFSVPPWEKIISLCEKALELAPAEVQWVVPRLQNAKARLAHLSRVLEAEAGDNELEVAQQRQDQDASQFSVLFRRKKLATILESHLRDQPLPYVLLLRQLFDRVEALGPDHFSSLPEFLLFAADFLAGESRTDSGQKQNVDYPLALRFYELSLEGKSKGLPAAHSGLLKVMLRSRSFERAEQAVVRAVAEAGDDPAIVMTAAKVMQEMGRPAVARLLAGRAVELSPVKAASKDVSSGLAADSEQDWLNIELIHDTANAAKAGKLGSVEEWLAEAQSQRGVARRTANADTAEIVRLTGWLREFFELLGHHLPGQLVDLDHYRHRAGIWFQDMDEAILHYFEQGWKARISSHPAFDESCVRRQLQEHRIDSSSEPPALLFLRHERALGLAPNTLFDPAVYLSGLTESPERPWFHYLEGGWQQNPNISPYFDAVRFRDQVRRKPEDALLSPLMFFLTRNTFLDVNGLFHAGFYDSRYRDSVKDMAPLAHYLSEGVYLGYQPNPFFVPQGKTARERLDYLKIHSVV